MDAVENRATLSGSVSNGGPLGFQGRCPWLSSASPSGIGSGAKDSTRNLPNDVLAAFLSLVYPGARPW